MSQSLEQRGSKGTHTVGISKQSLARQSFFAYTSLWLSVSRSYYQDHTRSPLLQSPSQTLLPPMAPIRLTSPILSRAFIYNGNSTSTPFTTGKLIAIGCVIVIALLFIFLCSWYKNKAAAQRYPRAGGYQHIHRSTASYAFVARHASPSPAPSTVRKPLPREDLGPPPAYHSTTAANERVLSPALYDAWEDHDSMSLPAQPLPAQPLPAHPSPHLGPVS